MKLWEKNFEINKEIERFTVGRDREMDLYLAKYDVLGSMAHITMLENIGLLEKEELAQLLTELKNIYLMAERGEFVIEDDVEDVHSQVEMLLTRKLGDMGKKIHSGRSRNDQVLVDLKLFTRQALKEIADEVKSLFDELIQKSNQYKDVLMPGYTHLQIAMPSSFGLWFGAYAESLCDDMLFLQAAYKMTNRNPLGSAAGYGSSFPLNRTMTTELLGFDSMPRWGVARWSAMWASPSPPLLVLSPRWPSTPACLIRRTSRLLNSPRSVRRAPVSCLTRRIPMYLN